MSLTIRLSIQNAKVEKSITLTHFFLRLSHSMCNKIKRKCAKKQPYLQTRPNDDTQMSVNFFFFFFFYNDIKYKYQSFLEDCRATVFVSV